MLASSRRGARHHEPRVSSRSLAGQAVARLGCLLIYRFGGFALDTQRYELRRGDRLIHVKPRELDVLIHLIENGQRTVRKAELLDALWPSTAVTDGVVSTAVHGVRTALGDTKARRWAIKTVPRRGYRFVPEVDVDFPNDAARQLAGREELRIEGRPAVAVLPFDVLSGGPEDHYFTDGLAEDLITRLSQIGKFPVIARNSSFAYRGVEVDLRRIGSDLRARYLVAGSVRRGPDRVIVTVKLVDVDSAHEIWSERVDRHLDDLFDLQEGVALAIAGSLVPNLHDYDRRRALREAPADIRAWDHAQRGWWHWSHPRHQDNARARTEFAKAVDLDGLFAWPHAGLALSHHFDLLYQTGPSAIESARSLQEAARRCVELDPRDPFGQLALGLDQSVAGDADATIRAMASAIDLDPSFAMGHRWFGLWLALTGKPDEGIRAIERGLQLSPRDPMAWTFTSNLALAHFAAGRYAEATRWASESARLRPDWAVAHGALASSLALLGRLEEARAAARRVIELQPGFASEGLRFLLAASAEDFLSRAIDGLRRAGIP